MDNFAQKLFNLLIVPPGNLVFHLILAFSIAAALQSVILTRRVGRDQYHRRAILGLLLILAAQLLLFASSGLAWQQVANPQRFLPPLDRALTAFSLLWIIWLWCYPTPSRLADALAVIFSIAIIIMAMFTVNNWLLTGDNLAFNGSLYDRSWGFFSLSLSLIGMLILMIRRPPAWGTGLAMLALIGSGHVANLLIAETSGHFSGVVRLAQLAAFPLLPALAQRFPAPASNPSDSSAELAHSRSYLRIVQTWMALAIESSQTNIYPGLARAVSQSMHADLCLLIIARHDPDQWQVSGGYDSVKEENLAEMTIAPAEIPALTAAFQRGRTVRFLPVPGAPSDLAYLAGILGLADTGPLLAAPLISSGKVWGGLILLRPYSGQAWTDEDHEYLSATAETLLQIIQRSEQEAQQTAQLQRLNLDLEHARSENSTLTGQLASLQKNTAAEKTPFDMGSVLAVQNELQEMITVLQSENDHLNERIRTLEIPPAAPPVNIRAVDDHQLEVELRMTLEEIAHLQNQLAQANTQITELQRRPTAGISLEQQEILTSISQELRQPMSSIMGYSEMMLSETAGPLSESQRNFIERIKSAAQRLRSMVDDLVRLSAISSGKLNLQHDPVDVSQIVDDAVAANTALLREKKITLRPDLPETLPHLTADQSILTQVLVDLLRNAASASPVGGSIILRVRLQPGTAQEKPGILLQVADSGGGIPANDLARVFQPAYRASDPLVQGVADGGFGLPVVKALVLAQGGEIWVENQPGQSARYSVRLPVENNGKEGSAASV